MIPQRLNTPTNKIDVSTFTTGLGGDFSFSKLIRNKEYYLNFNLQSV